MSFITRKWGSLRKESAPWRAFSDDFWNDYDACIATTEQGRGGRGNSYEVWTYGTLIATRPSLEEAQSVVEEVYGPLSWDTVNPPKVEVNHNYFGPTTEFTDPVVLHVAKLPKLG